MSEIDGTRGLSSRGGFLVEWDVLRKSRSPNGLGPNAGPSLVTVR